MDSRLSVVLGQAIPVHQRLDVANTAMRLPPVRGIDEPLVDIARFGIAGRHAESGQSIWLRESIAERLAEINHALATLPEITTFFGRPVELFVEQGWSDDGSFNVGAAMIIELRYAVPARGFDAAHRITFKGTVGERNRRAFYWIMRGALLGKDSCLVAESDDVTRWSYGDQRWALLTQAPAALYGPAKPIVG